MNDVSDRAREVLALCDFVAAEDTRVGGKLLMLLGLKKPLVSFHEHTGKYECEKIACRIKDGENCALVTDAGTPAVSDPGEKLVAACADMDIEIRAIPGPCAAVCAISASGLNSRRFCFEGFLPDKANERKERIKEISEEKRMTVIYIAPHDALKYLKELSIAMPDRKCVLAKEITKIHEKYFRNTILSVFEEFSELSDVDRRGEYVLVCEGKTETDDFWKDMTVKEHYEYYVSQGMSNMDACKQVSRDRHVGKSEIYDEINKKDI